MSQNINIKNNSKASSAECDDNDIPFYNYSRFENVKLINKNVYKANIQKIISQQNETVTAEVVALKCTSLNNKFTLNNFINEVKRHRKNLEINDNILKLYGITKQENTNNYMIVLEYANNGSFRQYLKTNFQTLDWNTKLNLAKQITDVLTFLHSNDIIHGKFNSENILIHNGNIKFNVFGLTKTISNSLRFLTNNLGPIHYISSGNFPFEMESSLNVDSLINISIPGTPPKYKEIYTDCWKCDENSRPDISQIAKNLSQIIISDASVRFETPQSQPYNVADIKLKNLNMQNEEPESKSDPPFDVTTEVNSFINDLFEFFIDTRKKQSRDMQPIIIKNYVCKHKKNPVEILYELIRHPFYYLYTSLIGFFYQYGIGTVADNQMAFKFFNLAANKIIDTSSNSSFLSKIYKMNKEIGTIYLAYMYKDGLGVDEDRKKAFRIYCKLADKGSLIALNLVAHCYENGFGVEKNEEKAFELYLKSAEKGMLLAQSNVGVCYGNGIGIKKDEAKLFQWNKKSALAGNINAMFEVGCCYDDGKDENEAFKWYLKAAKKGDPMAQHNLGCCYANGEGIHKDYERAVEWFKKAAKNDHANSQYMVGECFYNGRGIGKDIIKAIYWLNKAKENGHIYAEQLLEDLFDQ
ncbi:hypothetical protein Glove_658g1 [Diversispora epigaea]|uniref:Protein kinase domain-containing protein n=1 Tax=Diversispora epigaea TaxID=1348612 RepID=A0A397G447_9GLOM|nr:hypothetical protein Glove_658g1 [Diversispora epigaea]